MRISVFWVFDQDTDLHAPLQGLGRLFRNNQLNVCTTSVTEDEVGSVKLV